VGPTLALSIRPLNHVKLSLFSELIKLETLIKNFKDIKVKKTFCRYNILSIVYAT
jgi:hypothetical protein